MLRFDDLQLPIVQAPMAGGPSTPELAAAVSDAGGLGFLASGYRTAAGLRQDIARTRKLTSRPFGVNVFVPGPPNPESATEVAEYRRRLMIEAERLRVELPEPPAQDDDGWDDKIEALLQDPVPVVSFVFGLPGSDVIEALHRRDVCVVASATTEAEAERAVALGVDAICVQGPEAGAHRATHAVGDDPDPRPLRNLLAAVRAAVDVPLLAAGGVSSGSAETTALLTGGAVAVQAGTAYLLANEAGTSAVHRRALTDGRFTLTRVTRAFTGRPARGLVNRFMEQYDAYATHAYPQVHHLTRPLRAAAAQLGDPDGVHLWAGTGFAAIRPGPAADITRRLAGVA